MLISIIVPFEQPIFVSFSGIPPSISIMLPTLFSSVFVFIFMLDISDIEANASPLNPKELILFRSFSFDIFDVACLLQQRIRSSLSMPSPLSEIFIFLSPAFSISILISVAFASREFSSSSFITFAGRSITSPAAILFIRCLSRMFIAIVIRRDFLLKGLLHFNCYIGQLV